MNSVNVSNNVVKHRSTNSNIAYELSLLSAILIIEGKNKIFSYQPICQIVESERGNTQYFNLGLIRINVMQNYNVHLTVSGKKPVFLKLW
jgi:hypothetical protein